MVTVVKAVLLTWSVVMLHSVQGVSDVAPQGQHGLVMVAAPLMHVLAITLGKVQASVAMRTVYQLCMVSLSYFVHYLLGASLSLVSSSCLLTRGSLSTPWIPQTICPQSMSADCCVAVSPTIS